MKAIIVFHSEHGNTEKIAKAIEFGMKGVGFTDVSTKPVTSATSADFAAADIWVVGSPTHIGSATSEVKRALKDLKDGAKGKLGVAFDTRFKNTAKGATDKIEAMLSEGGVKILVPGEFFIVEKTKGPLAEGEEAKAEAFGKKIAAAAKQ
jgi:flavodoxin